MTIYKPLCPICSTPCDSRAEICATCHFEDGLGISPNWIDSGDAEEWLEDRVKPYRKIWELRKEYNALIKDRDVLAVRVSALTETVKSYDSKFAEFAKAQAGKNATLRTIVETQARKAAETEQKLKQELAKMCTTSNSPFRDFGQYEPTSKPAPRTGSGRVHRDFDDSPEIGSSKVYRGFGGHDWHILAERNGRVLLLSEKVLEVRKYNERFKPITWEHCTLRKYLNGEFYKKTFDKSEKSRIAKTEVINSKNSWYGTNGGRDTSDYVFLLSIEEVVEYFGDSGQLNNMSNKDGGWIDDKYSKDRIALDRENTDSWWWLRSPGYGPYDAAIVYPGGILRVSGVVVYSEFIGGGGVRPALWLNRES